MAEQEAVFEYFHGTGSKAPDCTYEYMITVIFKDCNDFSQTDYDCKINELQLYRFECTCGKKGCLIDTKKQEAIQNLAHKLDVF